MRVRRIVQAERSRSITGFSCPAKKKRAARSSSPLVPMYEPRIESCLENSALRLSAPLAPVVAPQVTSRPPRASARTLLAHVASPTCSMTTSTPRLFVSRLISSAMSCRWWSIDLGRPQRPGPLQLVVRPGGREHPRPVQDGDLNRRLADPAAGRQHQDVLASLQPGPRHQHVPRGEERQRKRGRLHVSRSRRGSGSGSAPAP